MNSWSTRIPEKYFAYFGLALWGALSFLLLNKSSYGIDEGAAQALLLIWSVADNVVSPIITSGLPDFRTIYLLPAGFLWPGNVIAAKVFTILLVSYLVWLIYAWRHLSGNSDSALLASGLLLISPLVVDQIDTISLAPYILITFTLGAWADKTYRNAPHVFGGMYFAQMFLVMISTSLHPIGLAYPLILLWTWYKKPIEKQRNFFFGGVVFSIFFSMLLTMGWHHTEWLGNPILSLSSLLLGPISSREIGVGAWMAGIIVTGILVFVIWKQARDLWSDLLGQILLSALIIGALVGDEVWGVIALTICLYWGFPLLLRSGSNSNSGFWGKRTITFTLLFAISTTFMLLDKARYQTVTAGELIPRDRLIKELVETMNDSMAQGPRRPSSAKNPNLIASQWPGLTMLACRCGALPLPPAATDEQALLAMLRGINYVIFDPQDPSNASLSNNLAILAGKVETIALQEGGVIVEINQSTPEKAAN